MAERKRQRYDDEQEICFIQLCAVINAYTFFIFNKCKCIRKIHSIEFM